MRTPREPSDRALREALVQQAKELRTLPRSWWDQEVQERMAQWLKKSREAQ